MIHIIAAIQKKDRGLGFRNQLLYRIPEDLKRFKVLTSGHPVIMGRKTFQSIGRPLPNRTNIVISRNENFSVEGAIVVHSLDKAINKAKQIDGEIFILGGGEIYKESLGLADILDLTIVEGNENADVFFPEYKKLFKKVTFEEKHLDSEPRYVFTQNIK